MIRFSEHFGPKHELRRAALSGLAFLIQPAARLMGPINILQYIGILHNEWYSLWTQHTLFIAILSACKIGVYCSFLFRLAHMNHNWNALMTRRYHTVCLSFKASPGLRHGGFNAALDRPPVFGFRKIMRAFLPRSAGAGRVAFVRRCWRNRDLRHSALHIADHTKLRCTGRHRANRRCFGLAHLPKGYGVWFLSLYAWVCATIIRLSDASDMILFVSSVCRYHSRCVLCIFEAYKKNVSLTKYRYLPSSHISEYSLVHVPQKSLYGQTDGSRRGVFFLTGRMRERRTKRREAVPLHCNPSALPQRPALLQPYDYAVLPPGCSLSSA